jgi:hypothetical protein
MIFKEEIVLGIYSWLHMTPVSILVRNITSDGGSFAIVRLTVDSRGVQMGPKARASSYVHLVLMLMRPMWQIPGKVPDYESRNDERGYADCS